MKITPDSLVDAAETVGELGKAVHDTNIFPYLLASRGVAALSGSSIATALAGADAACSQAKNTLSSRYTAISDLLYTTATSFTGKDIELADDLTKLGDLNSKQA